MKKDRNMERLEMLLKSISSIRFLEEHEEHEIFRCDMRKSG
jgi:hypothetical protein